MCIDDAIEIKVPEPDSHYRLVRCRYCSGDNVAYVKYLDNGAERWKGMCFDCGFSTEGADVRHDAQRNWNGIADLSRRIVACAG